VKVYLILYRNNAYEASSKGSREEVPGATVYVNFPLHVVPHSSRKSKPVRRGGSREHTVVEILLF